MNYDEIWGIEVSRVRDFFEQQSDVSYVSEDKFAFRGARISIEALEDRHLGSLHFARTHIKITGGADSEEIHRRIYIRFMSAGG